MQATAISSINRRKSSMNLRMPTLEVIIHFQTTQEHRKIKRWPDRRLAPNRNPSVRGWIRSLIVSIKTITGIKGVGVPCGTR